MSASPDVPAADRPPAGSNSASASSAPSVGPANGDNPRPPPFKSQLSDLFSTLHRLASLQLSIWITHVKLSLFRVAAFAILSFLALLLALVALIFLYAGIYYVLADLFLIPAAWTLLIFAAVHFLLAALLVLLALIILSRSRRPRSDKAADH